MLAVQEQAVRPILCSLILMQIIEVRSKGGRRLLIEPPAATTVEKLSLVFAMRVRVKVCIYLLARWMMRRLLWVHVFDKVCVCMCVSLSVLEFSSEDLVCLHDVSSLIHAATLPLTRRMTLRGGVETGCIHHTA